MKKITLLLTAIVLTSCATRKVDTQINKKDSTAVTSSKEVTQTKTDSVSQTVIIDNTVTDEIEIKPLDSTKPLIVNGKTYFNAVLRYKKQSNDIRTNQSIKVAKNELKEVKKNSNLKVTTKDKVKKTEVVRFPLWWIIILVLLGGGYYVYRRYRII